MRAGCFKRTASKHVYYLGWNRSPAQVGCMRQALGPGARGRPRGIGWRGRWEGGSGWGTHVNPWLFQFNVWQNSLQKQTNKQSEHLHRQRWQTQGLSHLTPGAVADLTYPSWHFYLLNLYLPLHFSQHDTLHNHCQFDWRYVKSILFLVLCLQKCYFPWRIKNW